MITVDNDVCKIIQNSDLSVRKIAEKSGVSFQTIYGWINETRAPFLLSAAYVLDTLGYELKIVKKGGDK